MGDRTAIRPGLFIPILAALAALLAWSPGPALAAHDLSQDCYVCHNIKSGQVWAGSYSIWSGKAIGMPSYQRPITCDVCHSDYGDRFKATSESHHPVEVIAGSAMQSDYDNGVRIRCRDCHNADAVTALSPNLVPDLAPTDYNSPAGNTAADGYPNHDVSSPDNQVAPGDPPHLLSMLLSGGQRTVSGASTYNRVPSSNPASDYAFCLSCHDGSANTARAVNVRQDYIDKGHYFKSNVPSQGIVAGDRMPCSDCHASHNSPTNARLLEPDNATFVGTRPSGLAFANPNAPTNAERRALCTFCHDDYNASNTGNGTPTVRTVEPSPRRYGVTGHAPSDTQSCTQCHNPHKTPGGGPDCLTCHTTGGAAGPAYDYIDALFKGVGPDGAARPADAPPLVWSQHGGFTGSTANFLYTTPYNTKGTNDCFKCHGNRHSNTYALIDADNTDSYAFDPAVGMHDNTASGIANANAFCLTCHDGNGAASDIQIGNQVPPNVAGYWATTGHGRPQASGAYTVSLNNPAYLKCIDCHEVHGSNHAKLLPAKKDATGGFAVPAAMPEKTFRNGALLARNVDFTDYSSPASGKGFGTAGDPGDQRAPSGASTGLCDACHRQAGRANGGTDNVTNKAHTHEGITTDPNQDAPSQMNFAKDCLECHDPHGTPNIEMVDNTINGYAVTFTARTGANSFDPAETGSNPNVNSVCVVCHQNPTENTTLNVDHNFRTSTVNPDHNEGSNCTSCHPHGNPADARKFGFPQAACNSCHGAAADTTGMPASGDGATYHPDANNVIGTRGGDNTAHKIHVNYLVNKRGVSAGNSCYVCHKGGGSQESHPGNPANRNFKSGTQPTAVPYVQVALDNGGTGSVLNVWNGAGSGPTYSGTPGQAAGAAAGWKTCSNTTCHYALSPSWSGKKQISGDTVTVTGDNTAPASIAQGATDDFLRFRLQVTAAGIDNQASFTGLVVAVTGTVPATDIDNVIVYRDANADGVWQATDNVIGYAASPASSPVTVTLSSAQTVTGTISPYYFVVYKLKATATVSGTVGARLDNNASVTLAGPDQVDAANFPIASSTPAVTDVSDQLTLTGANVAPATIVRGYDDAFLRLTPSVNQDSVTWTGLVVTKGGTAPVTDLDNVIVYRDANADNVWQASDTVVGYASNPAASPVTVTFSQAQTITTAAQPAYFVVYSPKPTATTGNTLTAQIAADADIQIQGTTDTRVRAGTTTSGAATITLPADTVTVTGDNTAPASLAQGATDDFLRFRLQVTTGTQDNAATWTALSVTVTGTGSAADLDNVIVYRDANADGVWQATDNVVGFTASPAASPVSVNVGSQSITTAISPYYFVVYKLKTTANAAAAIGAQLASAAAVTLAAPDTVGSANLPLSSSNASVTDVADALTVTGTNVAPANIAAGTDNAFLRLVPSVNQDNVIWTGLVVTKTGTAPVTDLDNVIVYRDANADNVWQASDTVVGYASNPAASPVTVTFTTPQTITTAAQPSYFVVLSPKSTATAGNTVGASIAADADIQIQGTTDTRVRAGTTASGSATIQGAAMAFPATTYIVTIDNVTALGWGNTNMTSGTAKTTQDDNTLLVKTGEVTNNTYYSTNNTTERTAYNAIWNTPLASGSNTTVTGVTFEIRVRKANTNDRIRLQLMYFNPSNGAATSIYDTGLVDSGGGVGTTTIYTHTSDPISVPVPDGMKLGLKVNFRQGSTSAMRVYVATGTPGQNTRFTLSGTNSTGVAPAPPRQTGDTTPIACNTCHQFAPDDATAGYSADGQYYYARPGSHAKHGVALIGGTDPAASNAADTCTICHPAGTSSFGSDHADGAVDLRSGSIGTRAAGPAFSDDGTYDNATRTCSNVYCHAGRPTPQATGKSWGYGSAACGVCHAVTPPFGKHAIHNNGNTNTTPSNGSTAANYDFSCYYCHPSGAAHVNYPVTAGVRAAEVAFSGTLGGQVLSGTYTAGGAAAGWDNVTNQGLPWTNGSCASVYCHSNGQGGAPLVAPTWNHAGFPTATCTGCHDNGNHTYASPTQLSSSHRLHTATDNYALNCRLCHNRTVTGADNAIADRSYHVNGTKDAHIDNTSRSSGGGGGGTYVPGTGCNNNYCHSNGQAVPTYSPIAWGTARTCTSCHGGGGGASTTLGGAHGKHVNSAAGGGSNIGCEKCHAATVSNGSTISNFANHVNGSPTVSIAGGGTYAGGGGACNNTYCHGTASPNWAGGTTNCQSCHVSQNIVAGQTPTGAHDRHTNQSTYKFACEACHATLNAADNTSHAGGAASGTNPGGSAVNAATQTVEVRYTENAGSLTYGGVAGWDYRSLAVNPFLGSAASPTYASLPGGTPTGTDNLNAGIKWGAGTCGSVWCHSNAKPLLPSGQNRGADNNVYAAPAWQAPGAPSCTVCHKGADTAANMAYNAVSNRNALSDYHVKHVASDRYNFTCDECHAWTVQNDSRTAIVAGTGYDNHVDGTKRVRFSTTLRTGSIDQSGGTYNASFQCVSTYCHSDGKSATPPFGSSTSIAWNAASGSTCTSCHDGAGAATTLSARHQKHTDQTAGTGYNFNCDECHALTMADNSKTALNASTGYANHVDGTLTVSFSTTLRSTAIAIGGTYTQGTDNCANTYCHSDGTRIKTGSISANSVTWGTAGPLACNACHGNPPSYTSAANKANSHGAHVAFGCQTCHSQTTTTGNTITGADNHVNGVYNVSGTGFTYTFNAAGSTCAFTSGCHSGTVTWGGGPLANGCFACHTGSEVANKPLEAADGTANPVDMTQYNSVGHGNSTTFAWDGIAGPAFLYGNTGVPNNGCYECHSSGASHIPKSGTDPYRLGTWASNVDGLCNDCHGPSAANPRRAANSLNLNILGHNKVNTGSARTWPGNYDYKCVDCHDPHGDGNYYLIRSAVNNPVNSTDTNAGSNVYGTPKDNSLSAITFTSLAGLGANSYAIAGAADGICEVCHNQTTLYNATGSDNAGTHASRTGRCTSCHGHLKGFAPTACKGCHGPDGVAPTAPDISAYWTTSGHGKAAITSRFGRPVECEDCHDGSYLTGSAHKTDGSVPGSPPNNINTEFWPGKSPLNADTNPNANTSHLKSGFINASAATRADVARTFDNYCATAAGCHGRDYHRHQKSTGPPPQDVMRFGDPGTSTTANPKQYNWYALGSYATGFYRSQSPWVDNDIRASSGLPDQGTAYGLCVSCHDPHGTATTDTSGGYVTTSNHMVRGNWRSDAAGFCTRACHTSRTPP